MPVQATTVNKSSLKPRKIGSAIYEVALEEEEAGLLSNSKKEEGDSDSSDELSDDEDGAKMRRKLDFEIHRERFQSVISDDRLESYKQLKAEGLIVNFALFHLPKQKKVTSDNYKSIISDYVRHSSTTRMIIARSR